MFVRRKKNRTGTISVVVVDKSQGRFKEIKNFGIAHSEEETEELCKQAQEWIFSYGGQQVVELDVAIRIKLPNSGQEIEQTLFLSDQHKLIQPLFDIKSFLG